MEQHDRQIAALLEEKVGIFADMLALGSGCSEPPSAPRGTPFPGDLSRGPRGDVLLHDAIREGTGAPGWGDPGWEGVGRVPQDAPGCSGMEMFGMGKLRQGSGVWEGLTLPFPHSGMPEGDFHGMHPGSGSEPEQPPRGRELPQPQHQQ